MKGTVEDEEFDQLVGCLEDVVIGDDFQELQDSFLAEHCDTFDVEDENKLEYTEIFNKYITLLEGKITDSMCERMPGFKMGSFIELIKSRKDEVDCELFDMLASFADFIIFKETMLNYKSQRENNFNKLPDLMITSLASALPRQANRSLGGVDWG